MAAIGAWSSVGQSRLYTANERTEEMGAAVVGYRHAWLGSFERRGLVAGGGAAGCLWGCCFVLFRFCCFVLLVQLQRALRCATHGVAGVAMVSLARCRLLSILRLVVVYIFLSASGGLGDCKMTGETWRVGFLCAGIGRARNSCFFRASLRLSMPWALAHALVMCLSVCEGMCVSVFVSMCVCVCVHVCMRASDS